MAEEPGWENHAKQAAAIVAAFTAVITSVVGLVNEVTSTVPLLGALPVMVRWGLLVAVFALGVVLWAKRPRRRPEPWTATARPFVGRDRDLKNLQVACVGHRLVFLIGDSGVGKSALIDRALQPSIASDKQFTLVVARHWGDDWVRGPERMMAAAVEELRLRAGDADATGSWIEYAKSLGQRQLGRLLVVFDGFDDYSVRFHDRLFVNDENQFIATSQLCLANPFWNTINQLLQDNVIHCVFVTRTDAQKALGAIRFVEPKELYISKLSQTSARELLESAVITTDTPQDWLLLCNELLADLDEGGVLPAQVVSAERALRRLARRTVHEYRSRGGLLGLELEQLQEILNQAAHAAGVPIASAQNLLNRMTDETTIPPKARSLTINEAAFPSIGLVPLSAATKIILILEREQVVRATQPKGTWILYHDYAARIVAAMKHRTDHWTARLVEARKRARAAHGPLRRYFALPSPLTQLAFMFQRLIALGRTGSFRYAEFRAFALLSLVRFVPWACLLIGAAQLWRKTETAEEARQLFARFTGRPVGLQPSEVEALWQLKQADESVQRAFIDHSFELPESAAVLSRRTDYVVHAIVGFERARRARLLAYVQERCLDQRDLDLRFAAACLRIGLTLESTRDEFWRFAFDSLWRKMNESLSPGVNHESDISLEEWVTWLVQSHAPRPLSPAVTAAFFSGLGGLLEHPLLQRPEDHRGNAVARSLQRMLQDLDLKIPEQQAAQLAIRVVASSRLPADARRNLMWRFAVRVDAADLPRIAKLVVDSAGMAPGSYSHATDPLIPGTAVLFHALIVHAQKHPPGAPLLQSLKTMLDKAPIETPIARAKIAALLPRESVAPFVATGDGIEELEEARTEIHRSLAPIVTELNRLAGPGFALDLRRETDQWLRLPALLTPSSRQAAIDQFWELTHGHPAHCVVAATVALSDFEEPLRMLMAGLEPTSSNDRVNWLKACVAAGTAVSQDHEPDERPLKQDALEKAEAVVREVVEGRRLLDDAGALHTMRIELADAEGKLRTESARTLIAKLYEHVTSRSDHLSIATSLAVVVASKAEDPAAIAAQTIVDERTATVEGITVMLHVLGALDRKSLNVPDLDDMVLRIIKRMRASPQGSWSDPLAELCRNLTTGQAGLFRHVMKTLLLTTDVAISDALRPCLLGLRDSWSGTVDLKDIVRLLEWPTCVGRCQTDLITALHSEGNDVSSFWAVERWARSAQLLPGTPVTRPGN
jgi:hypothetical protein